MFACFSASQFKVISPLEHSFRVLKDPDKKLRVCELWTHTFYTGYPKAEYGKKPCEPSRALDPLSLLIAAGASLPSDEEAWVPLK